MAAPRRVLVFVAVVLGGVGLACVGGEGAECRASEDCSGTLECAGPSDPQVCGIPGTAQCNADADCGEGLVCHAIPDSCSPDGVGSECRVACVEGGCIEGFRCGAAGACEAVPCDEGFECAAHESCDPSVASSGPIHARAHGCVAIACSEDGECPAAGACVNGVCQTGPGSCVEPMAVP